LRLLRLRLQEKDREVTEVAMQSETVVRRHLLVWRDPPVWPFLWRGLLPLLGLALAALFAFGPFARSWIEGPVQRETREQLNAAGYGWVGLRVSGQNVTLTGNAPTASAGERAIALAKAASCPTWLGRRTCAVSVVADFATPAPILAAAAAAVTKPAPAAAQACEGALASLLAGEQIQFASANATISARSAPLLDRLAHEARACPGNLRIQGHTDNVGRANFNLRLSDDRAAAVRAALIERGVAAERLQSEGFGAQRPVADNHTAAGRAKNRRIEFHTS
jgi:outer membrane protein OmpA-like peptidoglycan-associated protein